MQQNLVEWAGVFGFGLASLSLLIHLLQYLHQKRVHKEETEERVKVSLRWQVMADDVSSPLIATVVNTGRIDVHLDRVELVYGPENGQVGQQTVSIPLARASRQGPVVKPGDKREYFVQPNHPGLPKFAASNPNELRLVVYSHRGEIGRALGKEVLAYLKQQENWP